MSNPNFTKNEAATLKLFAANIGSNAIGRRMARGGEPINDEQIANLVGLLETKMNEEHSGKTFTKAVQIDYKEINEAINDLKSTGDFQDPDGFDLLVSFTIVNEELALKLMKNLKGYARPKYDALMELFGSESNAALAYFKGRRSILTQITYLNKTVIDKKYEVVRSGETIQIRTGFDVGRLCPPKCKEGEV